MNTFPLFEIITKRITVYNLIYKFKKCCTILFYDYLTVFFSNITFLKIYNIFYFSFELTF